MPPLAGRDDAVRAVKHACTGSIGEEHFVAHHYFGGANGTVMRGGTFLELGANDGLASNTLYLEQCLEWRGILIEGQPDTYELLRKNRPSTLALGTAICPKHGFVNFTQRGSGGDATAGIKTLMDHMHIRRWRLGRVNEIAVPCGPLGDWLKMLHIGHIDFFSLDVEVHPLCAPAPLCPV